MSMHPFRMPPVRRPTVGSVAIVAVLVAACGGTPDAPTTDPATPDEDTTDDPATPDEDTTDDPATPDEDTTGETDVEAMAFAECETDRYTVGYPEEWQTSGEEGLLGPCEVFHPGEIDEPDQPRDRDLHYAVSMYIDEVEFDDLESGGELNEVLDEGETTVDGRDARVVEYRSSGSGLIPEGERSTTWTVDLDGEILVATTSSVGDTDYERDRRILERMITEELTVHDRPAEQAAPIEGPATTARVTQEPDGGPLTVTDVRVGTHGSFDRITFEIAGEGEAGWLIEYDPDPRSQGRGDPVEVGGDAVLRVALRGMAYPTDAPAEPYDGPERIQLERTTAIVEVVEDVLYEGYHDFFVGLDEQRPYRVERLTDPQRVVIDIETP